MIHIDKHGIIGFVVKSNAIASIEMNFYGPTRNVCRLVGNDYIIGAILSERYLNNERDKIERTKIASCKE